MFSEIIFWGCVIGLACIDLRKPGTFHDVLCEPWQDLKRLFLR